LVPTHPSPPFFAGLRFQNFFSFPPLKNEDGFRDRNRTNRIVLSPSSFTPARFPFPLCQGCKGSFFRRNLNNGSQVPFFPPPPLHTRCFPSPPPQRYSDQSFCRVRQSSRFCFFPFLEKLTFPSSLLSSIAPNFMGGEDPFLSHFSPQALFLPCSQ